MLETTDKRYEQIYAEHHRAVLAYCRRRVDRQAAVDVAAEVFAIAWRKRDALPSDNALPWLYTVARNTVANHNRAAGRRRIKLERVAGQAAVAADDDPALHVIRLEEDRQLLEALSGLSEPDQEVLRLVAWEELSPTQIGDMLGLTPNAVTKRVRRASERLQRAFAAQRAKGGRR